MQRGLLAGIALGVAMTIFALQNSVRVPLKFLWMKFEDVPLALTVLLSILLGVTIVAIFSYIEKQKLRMRIRRLQTRIKSLEGNTTEESGHRHSGDLFTDDGIILGHEKGSNFFDQ